MAGHEITLFNWEGGDGEVTDFVQCPQCYAVPMTRQKLIAHQRQKHKIPSSSRSAVARRQARQREKGIDPALESAPRPQIAPPNVPGITPHRAVRNQQRLQPGDTETIRKELLYWIQRELAPRFDANPAAIVSTIKILLERNLEPPPAKLRSVPLGDIIL